MQASSISLQAHLEAAESEPPAVSIFQTPLEDFDILIRLRPEALPYPDRALADCADAMPSTSKVQDEDEDVCTNHKQARGRLHSIPRGTPTMRPVWVGFPLVPSSSMLAVLTAVPALLADGQTTCIIRELGPSPNNAADSSCSENVTTCASFLKTEGWHMFVQALSVCDAELLLRKGAGKLRRELLIGFDPVGLIIEQIQQRFEGPANFFVDMYGGSILALKWVEKADLPVPFEAAKAHMLKPCSDGPVESSQCVVSTTAVLSDLKFLGAGLVQDLIAVA